MADDLHLPYPAEAADPNAQPLSSVTWGVPNHGQWEIRRKPLPFQMQATWDRTNGNRVIIPYRIRAERIFDAINCVLGWSTTVGGKNGSLRRRLPVSDEQGFGMVAVRIASIKFHASSKIKPGGFDNLGADLYQSRIYGDTHDPAQPGLPTDAQGHTLPELWKDDAYQTPDTFTDNIGMALGRNWRAIKETRYAVLSIEFAHVPYDLLSDQTLDSGPYNSQEKFRFCYSEYTPSVEYVTTKAIQLKFANDADADFANKPCGTEAGFARPTGELLVHWHRIPADAVSMLFNKFEDANDGIGPRYGTVNSAQFSIPQFGTIKNYAPETLLFNGCRTELRFSPYGPVEYDLHYHFNYRYGGWNKFITGQSGKLQHVVRNNGDAVYRTSDFEELFKVN